MQMYSVSDCGAIWMSTDATDQAGRRHQGLSDRRSRNARARRASTWRSARRVRVDRRAVGLRQVDAAVDPRPARLADRRRVHAERPAGRRPAAVGARARAQPRDRVHLPELQPDWRSHRLRERRAAAHLSRHGVGRARAARRPRRSSASAWRTAPSTCPASSRAVSSSASPWRAPSPASRSSCSPTSRPATSIRRAAKRSWICSRAAPGRRDDLHGHARSALRAPRRAQHPLFDGRVVEAPIEEMATM